MAIGVFFINSSHFIDIPLGYCEKKNDMCSKEEQIHRILRLLGSNLSKRRAQKFLQRRSSNLSAKLKQLNCVILL